MEPPEELKIETDKKEAHNSGEESEASVPNPLANVLTSPAKASGM